MVGREYRLLPPLHELLGSVKEVVRVHGIGLPALRRELVLRQVEVGIPRVLRGHVRYRRSVLGRSVVEVERSVQALEQSRPLIARQSREGWIALRSLPAGAIENRPMPRGDVVLGEDRHEQEGNEEEGDGRSGPIARLPSEGAERREGRAAPRQRGVGGGPRSADADSGTAPVGKQLP